MNNMSPDIFINLSNTVCCFIFLLFLFISYFTKKNMDNIENKIYRYMLVANMATVVAYFGFYLSDILAVLTNQQKEIYPIVYFFSKLAPMFIILWMVLLVIYLYIISYQKKEGFIEDIKKNEKKYTFIILGIWGIISIISAFEKATINLATGMENELLVVMNISLYVLFVIMIYLILKNKKKLPKRKALPIYSIIPIALIALIVGMLGIKIALLFLVETVIDHLMYHTIENPDMKMIAQLELAKSQAEKSSEAKSDFLSSMSHEIRTPLNAIVGLSQVMKEEYNIDNIHKDLDDIIIASDNLREIIDGILDINKLESGEIDLIETNYNIRDEFEKVFKMIRIRIGEKPLELRTNYDENLPTWLYGDKDKIKQILTNLLTNAVKYTEKGFIDFNVFCKNDKDKCRLTISVRDTGRGIKKEQQEKLFTKFNRLEEDKDSDIEGTGLGLAVTKYLVELFEGSITVDTIYGQGSTFTVNITQKISDYNENVSIKNNQEEIL